GGGEIDGRRVIEPETVEWFTSRHREKLHDHTFKVNLDWGLGFMINSPLPAGESDDDDHDKANEHGIPYGFGPGASHDTFGHGGNQSSIAFADPEHQLIIAIVCNGMPGEEQHHRRMHRLLSAVYRDLGLDGQVRPA
ncbi:MAG: beta-lactamase family protein, partial [Firmicutes bacterium]|nr:beta-lactamase family protein [Bacillota bacterium]